MQGDLAVDRRLLPVEVEQEPGREQPTVPFLADLLGRPAPLTQPLAISRQTEVDQLQVDLAGQLDQLSILVDRHEQNGEPLVPLVVVTVDTARQKRVERNLLDLGQDGGLLGHQSIAAFVGQLTAERLGIKPRGLGLGSDALELGLQVADERFLLPKLRFNDFQLVRRLTARQCEQEAHQARAQAGRSA